MALTDAMAGIGGAAGDRNSARGKLGSELVRSNLLQGACNSGEKQGTRAGADRYTVGVPLYSMKSHLLRPRGREFSWYIRCLVACVRAHTLATCVDRAAGAALR